MGSALHVNATFQYHDVKGELFTNSPFGSFHRHELNFSFARVLNLNTGTRFGFHTTVCITRSLLDASELHTL